MGLDVQLPAEARPADWDRQPSYALARMDLRGPMPSNPAEVLALLMDFSGSVALAELLHAPAPDGHAHPGAAQLAANLQDVVRIRLDALLAIALRQLADRRVASLPEPAELIEAIAKEGAARLARELGRPLRSAFGAGLRQLQMQFGSLRIEIALELQALGPRAERLERIDAAFQRSIQRKLGELFERMQLAAESGFERACRRACALLPEDFGPDDLRGWSGPTSWYAHERERCQRRIQTLYEHLRRSLESLLLAAIQAEVPQGRGCELPLGVTDEVRMVVPPVPAPVTEAIRAEAL